MNNGVRTFPYNSRNIIKVDSKIASTGIMVCADDKTCLYHKLHEMIDQSCQQDLLWAGQGSVLIRPGYQGFHSTSK